MVTFICRCRAEWGEQGYIRLQQGVTAQEGLCGIAMAASYPTKEVRNVGSLAEVCPFLLIFGKSQENFR